MTAQHPALGLDLGTEEVSYTEQDAILYALAVGAPADELDLVFERDLHVLPTYALVLGRWGMEALREAGHFDAEEALHGAQTLRVLKPLPKNATFPVTARVTGVWDKGSAAVFDVHTSSEYFEATASVFAHNRGGWGGDRGPSSPAAPSQAPTRTRTFTTQMNQPALYRLTGDPHLIHIDPEAARAIGQPRPILHGLCTLGFAAREVAALDGRRPYDIGELSARFSKPALPGTELEVHAWDPTSDGVTEFAVHSSDGAVLSAGRISYRTTEENR